MRKIDPADVRDDLATEAQAITESFDRTCTALRGTATQEQDISRQAMTTFLALFVAFERFLSDLFLAYLNRDFSIYQTWLGDSIAKSAGARFGPSVGAMVHLTRKPHLTVDEIENILDPRGWNLTFSDVAQLRQRATDWLLPAHAGRINSINAHEERLVNTARTIRDFIAHQSKGSKAAMNAALANVQAGPHNLHMGRGARDIHAVGAFLKAQTPGAQRRLHRYSAGLVTIAHHL